MLSHPNNITPTPSVAVVTMNNIWGDFAALGIVIKQNSTQIFSILPNLEQKESGSKQTELNDHYHYQGLTKKITTQSQYLRSTSPQTIQTDTIYHSHTG